MDSTRKKKNQQKKQLSQLDETWIDFVIDNSVNVNVLESETLEQLTNVQSKGFERDDNGVRQNQVIQSKIEN